MKVSGNLLKTSLKFLFLLLLFLILVFVAGCAERGTKVSPESFGNLSSSEKGELERIMKEYGNCTCGDCDLPLDSCDCGEAQAVKEKIVEGIKRGQRAETILNSLKEGRERTPAPLLTTSSLPREGTGNP
jgi:hypothetical protein